MSWGHDGRYFLSEYNFTFIHYSILIEVKTLDIIIEDITCIATQRCKISLRVLKNISPVSIVNL